MKTQKFRLRLRPSVLAVHGALGLMAAAHAQTDPALLEQTAVKRSTVELGVGTTSSYSAKANEWTGLTKKGPFGIVNFEASGGGAYDSDDTKRWSIVGTDLTTEVRSLSLDLRDQGAYRIRLGYDELRRNTSDSYRTPYLGVGGSSFTLPSNWVVPVVPRLSTTTLNGRGLSSDVTTSNGIVAGVSTPPTAAQLAQSAALQNADLPDFHNVDLFTKRTRFSLGWDQLLSARWSLNVNASMEQKTGLRPLAVHADAPAETSTVLPLPVDQRDERLSLGVSYTGDDLQAQATWSLSSFTNNVSLISWNTWSVAGNSATPTVASNSGGEPSNLFQKLQASANYRISPSLKLVGAASYSTTAQNELFSTDASSVGTMAKGFAMPESSAHALVVNESASLKLISRTTQNLGLSAAVKYDLRENRTPVDTFIYYDNNTTPAATASPFAGLYGNPAGLGSNVNINATTPYSKRTTEGELDADYRLGKGHKLKAGWSIARTDRYCLNTWISCDNAQQATENTVHADWFGPLTEQLTGSLRLSAAHRSVDYNELAFLARVPMANQSPSSPSTAPGALAGTTAYGTLLALIQQGSMVNAFGRLSGLTPEPNASSVEQFYFGAVSNSSNNTPCPGPVGTLCRLNNPLQQLYYGNRNRMVEESGLRTYDQADRDRGQARAGLVWQATEALSLQAGGEYKRDRYGNSVYGLQKASNSALNLDANYAASDDFNIAVFASIEDQRMTMAGFQIQSAVNSANVASPPAATTITGSCATTVNQRNANYKIDPCMNWSVDSHDRTGTLGATLTKNKLFKGKLDLAGSLIYSDARSDIDVAGFSYGANPYANITGAATKSIAAYLIPASPFPTNRSKAFELRLGGTYHVASDQALRVGYSFRRLDSSDWGYEGMQPGGLAVQLPTFESAPTYRVHTIGVSYALSFR